MMMESYPTCIIDRFSGERYIPLSKINEMKEELDDLDVFGLDKMGTITAIFKVINKYIGGNGEGMPVNDTPTENNMPGGDCSSDAESGGLDRKADIIKRLPKERLYDLGYADGWQDALDEAKEGLKVCSERYTVARENCGTGVVEWSDYLINTEKALKVMDGLVKHTGQDSD